jgi:hypothetical protein
MNSVNDVFRSSGAAPCRMNLLGEAALALSEQSALMGVQWGPDGPTLDPAFFSCCAGTGTVMSGADVAVCDLADRLNRVRALHQSFRAAWGESFAFPPPPLTGEERRSVVESIDGFIRRNDSTGVVWNSPKSDGPSGIWDAALLAVWRFGLDVHVVTAGKTEIPAQIPPWVARSPGSRKTGILMVEGIAKAWQSSQVECLDLALSYASNGRFPLLVEFGRVSANDDVKNPPTDGSSSRSQYARRLASARSQPWKKSLPAWTWSRLESCCRGTERLG